MYHYTDQGLAHRHTLHYEFPITTLQTDSILPLTYGSSPTTHTHAQRVRCGSSEV